MPPPARFAFGILFEHCPFLPFFGVLSGPRCAERRILQNKAHFDVFKAILLECVNMHEVLRALPFDEHLGKPYRIGRPHQLLTKKPHIRCGIVVFDVVVCRGEHSARAACLVAHRDDLAVIKDVVASFCHQHLHQQLDHVPACVELSCIHVLIEPSDQVLEDVAHLDAVKCFNGKVQLRKRLHHRVKAAILLHLVDVLVDFQLIKDLAHVARKPVDVRLEIRRDVVRIVAKLRKVIAARAIKLMPRDFAHCLVRVVGVGFRLRNNRRFRLFQRALEPTDDRHRDDHITVFVRHVRAAQFVGDGPYEICLLSYVDGIVVPHRVDHLLRHLFLPFVL